MRSFVYALAAIATGFSSSVSAEPHRSSITLPISIDLAHAATQASNALPQRLATIRENNMLCYEGRKIKYEYPCLRGIKIYSCDGWTWGAPPIRCDVSGHVDRRGPLSLGGSGGTLRMSMPIHASVTAKALVQETAKADATFFVDATPSLTEDWKARLTASSDFRWDKRPTLELFGLIKVTIGSKVEPKLREKMREFEGQLPALLDDLDLRSEIEKAWISLQEPMQVSDAPLAYAAFEPSFVGFSGIDIANNRLNATVRIDGITSLVVGQKPQVTPVPLLPLQRIDASGTTFALSVPVAIAEAELQAAIDANLPDGLSFAIETEALTGEFTSSGFTLGFDEVDGIILSADVTLDTRSGFLRRIDIFNWFQAKGTARFQAIPLLDTDARSLRITDLLLSSDTSSALADSLVAALNLPGVRDQVAKMVTYDYEAEVEQALTLANEALPVDLGEGAVLSGNITDIAARDLVIRDDELHIHAVARGAAELTVAAITAQ